MALRTRIGTIIATHFESLLDESQRTDLERGIYNASLQEAAKKGVRKHWENPDFAE
jgi:hypothetical protein